MHYTRHSDLFVTSPPPVPTSIMSVYNIQQPYSNHTRGVGWKQSQPSSIPLVFLICLQTPFIPWHSSPHGVYFFSFILQYSSLGFVEINEFYLDFSKKEILCVQYDGCVTGVTYLHFTNSDTINNWTNISKHFYLKVCMYFRYVPRCWMVIPGIRQTSERQYILGYQKIPQIAKKYLRLLNNP